MTTTYDVAVVGAGPTGMTLATLLAQHGVSVALVERHHDVYPLPRAVHLDDEVYRILHQLGVGEEFSAMTRPALGLRLLDARHRVLATFSREADNQVGLPAANMFDQPDLERLLRDNLKKQSSVEWLSGHEVDEVEDAADHVLLRGRTDTGDRFEVAAAYVVGCDGANSVVRDGVGITSKDLGFEQRWVVIDIRSQAEFGAWDGVHQVCDTHRAGTYMRIGPERYRWEFQLLDGEQAEDFAEIGALRGLLDPWVAGVPDGELEVMRCVEYTFRARVAERWTRGRVLIAGDAAHLTPPFIGQGMCAGLRDAANLAWKLAQVVSGESGKELLESYEHERKPHATTMVKKAVMVGRIMTGGGRIASLFRGFLLPRLARVDGVRRVMLESRTPPLTVGAYVSAATPKPARGALLPLARVAGPDGSPVLIDAVLGSRTRLVRRPGVAAPSDFQGVAAFDLDAAAGAAPAEILGWFDEVGIDWAVVRPDRTVQAAGRG